MLPSLIFSPFEIFYLKIPFVTSCCIYSLVIKPLESQAFIYTDKEMWAFRTNSYRDEIDCPKPLVILICLIKQPVQERPSTTSNILWSPFNGITLSDAPLSSKSPICSPRTVSTTSPSLASVPSLIPQRFKARVLFFCFSLVFRFQRADTRIGIGCEQLSSTGLSSSVFKVRIFAKNRATQPDKRLLTAGLALGSSRYDDDCWVLTATSAPDVREDSPLHRCQEPS